MPTWQVLAEPGVSQVGLNRYTAAVRREVDLPCMGTRNRNALIVWLVLVLVQVSVVLVLVPEAVAPSSASPSR